MKYRAAAVKLEILTFLVDETNISKLLREVFKIIIINDIFFIVVRLVSSIR